MSDPQPPEGQRMPNSLRRLVANSDDLRDAARFFSSSAQTPSVNAGVPIVDTAGDKVPGWGSLGIVLSGYALVFGNGLFNAYIIEFEDAALPGSDFSGLSGVRNVVIDLATMALAITLLVLVTRYARRVPWSLAGVPCRGSRVWPSLMTAVVALAGLVVGGLVMAAVEAAIGGPAQSTNPGITGGGWAILTVFEDLRAGVEEEILIVAIPVLLLRRAGWSPAAVIGLSIALRWPFHIYHGFLPTLPWVAVWGGAFCALYLYLRRLTPLIIVHATTDFMIDSQQAFGVIAGILTAVVGLATLAWLAYRVLRQRIDYLDTPVSRVPVRKIARFVGQELLVVPLLLALVVYLFVVYASAGLTPGGVIVLTVLLVLVGALVFITASRVGWMAVDDRSDLRLDPDRPCLLAWSTPRPGVITINELINVDPFTAFRTVADHEPSAHTIRAFGVAKHAQRFAAAGHRLIRHPGDMSRSISMTRNAAADIG